MTVKKQRKVEKVRTGIAVDCLDQNVLFYGRLDDTTLWHTTFVARAVRVLQRRILVSSITSSDAKIVVLF